jgi:hypothetical protein
VPLKQQWHRRVPDFLVIVVGDDERDRTVGIADAADDRREDVGEVWADHHSLN